MWPDNQCGMPYNALFNNLSLPQFQPPIPSSNVNQLQGFYAAGIMVGLADGSVRLVNSSISAGTWASTVQPNDGVPLGPDW